MSTNKPRIQTYVDASLYQQFEQERSQWGLSQSQAFERILSERYQSDRPEQLPGDHDLTPLIASINELRLKVSTLEDELESRLLAKLESRLLGSLPSESELVTSESELVTSELDSSLPSELDSSLPSEVATGELITTLTKKARQALSESPMELSKFVICEIDQEVGRFTYWMGGKQGFSSNLEVAKRYKSEAMAERAKKGILENSEYERFNSNPSRFQLKYNPVRFFVENPTPKLKGKVLAAV